jgi:hypothetical protein
MAMKLNPITGEMENDGIPEAPVSGVDSNPIPDLTAPVPDQAMQGPGGTPLGTPDNPMVATIAPTPRPPVEIEVSSKRVTESPAERAAVTQSAVADGAVLNAIEQQGGVEQQEIGVKQQLDAEKIRLLQDHKKKQADAEAEAEKLLQERAAKEKMLVDNRAAKQIQAGRAHADFVQKNLVGAIIGALVSSVAAGLHAMNGKSGLSPAERIMETAYANHEKALIAEYQASKQAKEDFDENRPLFDAKIKAIKVRAANELEHDMKIALANADKTLSKLAPEKAAAAQAMKMALEKRTIAKTEQERVKGLRGVDDYKKTLRPMGDGTTTTAQLNPVLDPYTGKVIAELPKERMVEGRQSRDGQAALVALREWNSKFKQFMAKNGPVMAKWTPDARNQLKSYATEGAGLLTTANQTGVLNQGEYDRYVAQMTPDGLLGLFTSTEGLNRGLDEIVTGAERKQVGKVKTLVPGYEPKAPGTPEKPDTKPDVSKLEGKRKRNPVTGKWGVIKDGKFVEVPSE